MDSRNPRATDRTAGRSRDHGRRRQTAGAARRCSCCGANEVVPTETLVDELWGGRPPATATKIVQGYVSQLRKALGHGVLETRAGRLPASAGTGRRGRGPVRSPAGARTRRYWPPATRESAAAVLREALALWRGPPLVEFRFQDFAADEIDGSRAAAAGARVPPRGRHRPRKPRHGHSRAAGAGPRAPAAGDAASTTDARAVPGGRQAERSPLLPRRAHASGRGARPRPERRAPAARRRDPRPRPGPRACPAVCSAGGIASQAATASRRRRAPHPTPAAPAPSRRPTPVRAPSGSRRDRPTAASAAPPPATRRGRDRRRR